MKLPVRDAVHTRPTSHVFPLCTCRQRCVGNSTAANAEHAMVRTGDYSNTLRKMIIEVKYTYINGIQNTAIAGESKNAAG